MAFLSLYVTKSKNTEILLLKFASFTSSTAYAVELVVISSYSIFKQGTAVSLFQLFFVENDLFFVFHNCNFLMLDMLF